MEQKSMTALVNLFAGAYHQEKNKTRIFDDEIAGLLLDSQEYRQIAESMSAGIEFFHPGFRGNQAEALRWIVDNHLSPVPLGRAAFAEASLKRAASIGAGRI